MTLSATLLASTNGTQTRETSFAAQAAVLENVMILALQYDQTKTLIVENSFYQLTTPAATGAKFGYNSQIYLAHKKADDIHGGGVKMLGFPLPEPEAAVAATGEYDFTGTAITVAGNYVFYVNGIRLSIPCVTTDTPITIADKQVAAINARNDVGCTADNASGTLAVVTTTCSWAGTSGNDGRLLGPWQKTDEAAPAGLAVAITDMAGGVGAEDTVLEAAWAIIVEDERWNTDVIMPSRTATSLGYADAAIGLPDNGADTGSGLWADADYRPMTNWVGDIETTYATLAAITEARKDYMNNVVVGAPDRCELPFVIATDVCAFNAMKSNSNPATKTQGNLSTLLGPVTESNDWTKSLYDTALKAGIATIRRNSSGVSTYGDICTTYHPDGKINPVWQYENNKRKTWNIAKSIKDDKLVFDNDVIVESVEEASLQSKATDEDTEKARIISLVPFWVKYGWCYNAAFTINNLVVRINPSNSDRFDRAIPVLLSANKRVMSDTILVDRNLNVANADVVVTV